MLEHNFAHTILELYRKNKINNNDVKEIFKNICYTHMYNLSKIEKNKFESLDILMYELENMSCPKKIIDIYYDIKISMLYEYIDFLRISPDYTLHENEVKNIITEIKDDINILEDEYEIFLDDNNTR